MKKSFKFSAACKLVLMAGIASTLAACGGGGGSNHNNTSPVVPPPVSYAITVTGTAATGAAIVNANLAAACKVGVANAITGAEGGYTAKVPAPGEGPCILSVVNNGVTLRSLANGDGAKANITPLTEMLVSYIAISSGAGAAATPTQLAQNANVRTIVTNATLLSATVNDLAQVISAATNGAVVVPADFLTATLVPKSATNPGNAQDAVLEALKAAKVVDTSGAIAPALLQEIRKNAAENTVTGGTGGSGN